MYIYTHNTVGNIKLCTHMPSEWHFSYYGHHKRSKLYTGYIINGTGKTGCKSTVAAGILRVVEHGVYKFSEHAILWHEWLNVIFLYLSMLHDKLIVCTRDADMQSMWIVNSPSQYLCVHYIKDAPLRLLLTTTQQLAVELLWVQCHQVCHGTVD